VATKDVVTKDVVTKDVVTKDVVRHGLAMPDVRRPQQMVGRIADVSARDPLTFAC
jgi:hypothetical protein